MGLRNTRHQEAQTSKKSLSPVHLKAILLDKTSAKIQYKRKATNVYIGNMPHGINTAFGQSTFVYSGFYFYTILVNSEIYTLKIISTLNE